MILKPCITKLEYLFTGVRKDGVLKDGGKECEKKGDTAKKDGDKKGDKIEGGKPKEKEPLGLMGVRYPPRRGWCYLK